MMELLSLEAAVKHADVLGPQAGLYLKYRFRPGH